MRLSFILVSIVALCGMLGANAFADDFTSANFTARDPSVNAFGGIGTSSSFETVLGESQIEGQQSASSNFILDMGPLHFDTYAPMSQNWRWYADEENTTPDIALGAENAAPIDIEDQDVIKLRIAVAETAGFGASGVKFRLQFSTSSDFSSEVRDVAAQADCSGASWCYADGAGVDNAAIASSTLSDVDPCVAGTGSGCGTHNEIGTSTSSYTHEASAVAEYEFTIKQSGAAINTVYFFRLFDVVASSTVPLNTGEAYPSLVSGGASLVFTIGGVPSGTQTEDVTTDITTSSTDIPFGVLPEGAAVEGAQRLSVTTNGIDGYRIYLYERQGLISGEGAEIAPVSGTNATPIGWGSGCASEALGCFGYHTGDDLLSAGDTVRFAANDTYAQATSTPQEIAYHENPASNQATDVVYKIETKSGQDNGHYATSVVYIVTPVF